MTVRILQGDCRDVLLGLPSGEFQTCVTSPPYFGLRDYGHERQIGLEETPDAYVARLVDVFREVRRVLRGDGTCWLNLGDSYRNKSLLGIPWRVAFALSGDGWLLRAAIVWAKPNPMPSSVSDRPTPSYEMLFLLAVSERYFYDASAIREDALPSSLARYAYAGEDGRINKAGAYREIACGAEGSVSRGNLGRTKNPTIPQDGKRHARDVWTLPPADFRGAHFATMPAEMAERCIKAGSRPGDAVLDPFGGAGTTGLVADRLGRHATLIELNPEYVRLAEGRIRGDAPLFVDVGT